MAKPFVQGAPSDNLFITNMPPGLEEDDIVQIFGQYGMVQEARIVTKPELGWTAALIRYSSLEEAARIQEMLNYKIPEGLEKPISVRFAKYPRNPDGTYQNERPEKEEPGGQGAPGGQVQLAALPKILVDGTPVKPVPTPAPKAAPSTTATAATFQRAGPYEPGKRGYYALGSAAKKLDAGTYGPSRSPTSLSTDTATGTYGASRISSILSTDNDAGEDRPVTMDDIVINLETMGILPGGTGFKNDLGTVFVHGLPSDCTDAHLYQVFCPFGAVMPKGVRAVLNTQVPPLGPRPISKEKRCIGYGFVNFHKEESALAAIAALNGTIMPDGKTLKVTFKKDVQRPPKQDQEQQQKEQQQKEQQQEDYKQHLQGEAYEEPEEAHEDATKDENSWGAQGTDEDATKDENSWGAQGTDEAAEPGWTPWTQEQKDEL
eukprot:TRINITY_DN974_c0_g1_i4.p2 TRINITY_DN974_c0_g1~~TRINITY_DN974_c0_g1_i4.p2  ORF type:complete len:432 (-),score=115.22 TRINITY_DN974_c0_g1_i4:60-1355(-)